MNLKLTAVTLASVVVLSVIGAAGAGALGAVDAQAGNDAQTGDDASATVSASATGEVSAEPDRAIVHVAVTATGENASVATERLAENVSTLRDTLDDDNLSVVNVETTGYHVGPQEDRRDERAERGEERGADQADNRTYVARQSFAVTTDDVEGAGPIIDAAVNGGANEIHGVQFTLSEERRQELRADAIDNAVTDARAQAEAAASSTGLTLGAVDSVTVNAGPSPFLFETVESDVGGGTNIDPSPVTVSASVDVTYNATND